MSELAYKRTNVYETADERKLKEIFDCGRIPRLYRRGKNGARSV